MAHPPKSLQHVLWSVDVNKINLETDKAYIIHQIFAHGSFDDFRWLFRVYPLPDIIRVFTATPYKDYRPARFNFVKNILLRLKDRAMDPRRYVKNTPRAIG